MHRQLSMVVLSVGLQACTCQQQCHLGPPEVACDHMSCRASSIDNRLASATRPLHYKSASLPLRSSPSAPPPPFPGAPAQSASKLRHRAQPALLPPQLLIDHSCFPRSLPSFPPSCHLPFSVPKFSLPVFPSPSLSSSRSQFSLSSQPRPELQKKCRSDPHPVEEHRRGVLPGPAQLQSPQCDCGAHLGGQCWRLHPAQCYHRRQGLHVLHTLWLVWLRPP